ncbi:MAG: hypothetical protein EAY75_15065 [Bacteroidetes bacterium]|nr:MAG: hypothetical protein EAY75_15065 [Bacteroidota bacterium]
MNNIQFGQLGGMPLTQNILQFMQADYQGGFAALAALAGNTVILGGVQQSGNNLSAGWVIINGEVLEFEACLINTYVEVVELKQNMLFFDGTSKPLYARRTARCVAVGSLLFSNFVRLDALKAMQDRLVPAGLISMWSGDPTAVPAGWALCDGGGSPARPDLRGRFIVGYHDADADYNAIGVGADLGRKKVQLEATELPSHEHTISIYKNDTGGGAQGNTAYLGTDNGAITTSWPTQNTGGNQPHENRPPYYTLAYIIKL